ncbi:MAG: hypothetical protein HRU15_05720 [Planctomycetes bacterium]|nr:hypothetical protein [Planctomycetota bacterium]
MPFASDQPTAANPTILSGLKELYSKQDIQLHCFQEVQSQGAASAAAKVLSQSALYTSGNHMPQYGGAALSNYTIQQIDCSAFDFNRLCQLFKISIESRQLKIANVHLPSNRHLGIEGSQKQKRIEMEKLFQTHPDIDIICGDFNNYEGSDIYQLMQDTGYIDSAELFKLKHQSTFVPDDNKRGDFIWISAALSQSVTHYEVLPKESLKIENNHYLSDHLPVIIHLELSDEI